MGHRFRFHCRCRRDLKFHNGSSRTSRSNSVLIRVHPFADPAGLGNGGSAEVKEHTVAAVQMEKALAEELREQGYTVTGGT